MSSESLEGGQSKGFDWWSGQATCFYGVDCDQRVSSCAGTVSSYVGLTGLQLRRTLNCGIADDDTVNTGQLDCLGDILNFLLRQVRGNLHHDLSLLPLPFVGAPLREGIPSFDDLRQQLLQYSSSLECPKASGVGTGNVDNQYVDERSELGHAG